MFFRKSLIASLAAGAAVTAAVIPVDTTATLVATATIAAPTTSVAAVASAIIQGTSTTIPSMSTTTKHQTIYTPMTMTTVTKPAPTISKRMDVSSWQPIPTASTNEVDVKIRIIGNGHTKFEIYGKGFVNTTELGKKFTKEIKKCRIHGWELAAGDDLATAFKDLGWDFYGSAVMRAEKNLDCLDKAVSELGGPTLDLKPFPAWSCRVKFDVLTDRFVIRGTAWNATALDRDGVPGKGLHEEVKGCGLVTGWHYDQDVNGWDFVAKGFTTVFQRDCITHAMKSAGAPSGAFCYW